MPTLDNSVFAGEVASLGHVYDAAMTLASELEMRPLMHSASRPHPHPLFNQEEITRAPDEKIDGFGI
jgi:hypothetical protein